MGFVTCFALQKMSGASSRQSQMVADEMFPDGPGPLDFVDVEDGVRGKCFEISLPPFLALGHCWNEIPDLKSFPPRCGMVLLVDLLVCSPS